jgi:hypothetical protein
MSTSCGKELTNFTPTFVLPIEYFDRFVWPVLAITKFLTARWGSFPTLTSSEPTCNLLDRIWQYL